MQKSDNNQTAKIARRKVQASTTLNRKYVKKPVATRKIQLKKALDISAPAVQARSSRISRFGNQPPRKVIIESEIPQPTKSHPIQNLANQKLRERQLNVVRNSGQTQRLTAQQLKERAIQKALSGAAKQTTQTDAKKSLAEITQIPAPKTKKIKFGLSRIILAASCAAAAIFAIVYFVNLNMPDIQFRATAMQLNATYPNYTPNNYTPVSIASEGNIVTIGFKNNSNGDGYTIMEERSSWDSNSLLNNYVKEAYGENYSIVREQGITIYISNNRAAWVNGGIVYKLEVTKGSLTKKQISSIAGSF